jgi:hypothetical protein
MPYGNHARGAKFTDASQGYQKLENTINEMFTNSWILFGRMDGCTTFAELENGKTSLLELNGWSEPTHIYDPKHSLFFAWKELARHITYITKSANPEMSQKLEQVEYRLHLEKT